MVTLLLLESAASCAGSQGAELSFCSAYGMGQGSLDKEKECHKQADNRAEISPRDVSDMYASAALHAAQSCPLGAGNIF